MIPVLSIVGSRSNIGKTIVMEKIIKELKKKNYIVATIKHDVHGFEIDRPGKDTYRHAQAGADIVIISSMEKIAMIKKVDIELAVDDIINLITDVDIILVEGYKNSNLPKIEVFRSDICEHIYCKKEELVAIVSNVPIDIEDIPVYETKDVNQIVILIEEKIKKTWKNR